MSHQKVRVKGVAKFLSKAESEDFPELFKPLYSELLIVPVKLEKP